MSEIDTLLKEVQDVRAFMQEHAEKKIVPLKEEVERMGKVLTSVQEGFRAIQREQLVRMASTGDGQFRVPEGRLAGYTLLDLRILDELLKRRTGHAPISENLRQSVVDARKSIVLSITPTTILGWEDGAAKRRSLMLEKTAYPAMSSFRQGLSGWTRAMIEMQHKAMDSTTSGSGDQLVPTFEAAELWMDVNLETLVLPLLPQMPMPTNPFDIPSQLGDTNWYPASENIQVTTTSLSTAKATLTAYGLKTGVPFSDELEEDAVVALVPEIRQSLVRNAAEVIDDVILNADTTVTNGINSDGATINTSTAGKAQWLLGFDGLIHLPLVDYTAMSEDKAGAVDADIYNKILSTMGKYAVPRRRGEVVYISDVNTAVRSLSITEFETMDVAGARATLSTGELLNVYGKPLIQSAQMRLADTDGKVTSAGNATDTGRLLCVNTSQWRVGFRRQITVETDREPGKGQTTMYVSFRIALAERTGTRSTATHTALAYDITGIA